MVRPHRDMLDPDEENARIPGTRVYSMHIPRMHNNLLARFAWAHNIIHRLYRGNIEDDGTITPGWRDGDFGRPFIYGLGPDRELLAPVDLADAHDLFDRLNQGLRAAYLYELVDNADAVGTDKDKRKVRRLLEGGGYEQFNGHDWTYKDEADEVFVKVNLNPTKMRQWLMGITKPSPQGRA